jgi:hypothetical protein
MSKPRYRWDWNQSWWWRRGEERFEAYWGKWSIDAYH